ncbi:MAG: hypothetical protein AAFR51_15595 [Pseudomonadota bacterium]
MAQVSFSKPELALFGQLLGRTMLAHTQHSQAAGWRFGAQTQKTVLGKSVSHPHHGFGERARYTFKFWGLYDFSYDRDGKPTDRGFTKDLDYLPQMVARAAEPQTSPRPNLHRTVALFFDIVVAFLGDLPSARTPFTLEVSGRRLHRSTYSRELELFVEAGYATRSGTHYEWTNKAGHHMYHSGVWSADFQDVATRHRRNKENDYERLQDQAITLWDSFPDELKEQIYSGKPWELHDRFLKIAGTYYQNSSHSKPMTTLRELAAVLRDYNYFGGDKRTMRYFNYPTSPYKEMIE